jgi:hypothetical protein
MAVAVSPRIGKVISDFSLWLATRMRGTMALPSLLNATRPMEERRTGSRHEHLAGKG